MNKLPRILVAVFLVVSLSGSDPQGTGSDPCRFSALRPRADRAGLEEVLAESEQRRPLPAGPAYRLIGEFLRAIRLGKGSDEGYQREAVVDLRRLPPGKRVVFVGDMHGYGGILERVIRAENLEQDLNVILILSGDAVHPEDSNESKMDPSIGLMQRIMELKVRFPGRVYYVLGNHDKPTLFVRPPGAKRPVDLGEAYFQRMEELYPASAESPESYQDLYRQFLSESPLLVIGAGWLFVHQGPILNATLRQVREANVSSLLNPESPMDSVVRQALDGGNYNGGSVEQFLRSMGLPKTARIVTSHFHGPTDPSWHKKLMVGGGTQKWADTVHNIYAGYRSGRGRWGYARYREGRLEFVEFMDNQPPNVESYPVPVPRRAGPAIKPPAGGLEEPDKNASGFDKILNPDRGADEKLKRAFEMLRQWRRQPEGTSPAVFSEQLASVLKRTEPKFFYWRRALQYRIEQAEALLFGNSKIRSISLRRTAG